MTKNTPEQLKVKQVGHSDSKQAVDKMSRTGPGRRPTDLEDYKLAYIEKYDRIMEEIDQATTGMRLADQRGLQEKVAEYMRTKTRLKNELAAFESRLRKKLDNAQPYPEKISLQQIRKIYGSKREPESD